MALRVPAEVFPPGEFIRDELEARGWTQGDLAKILGRPLPALNQIINGKKAVTPETAKELAEAFGTSPEFWLNLESAYRLSIAKDPGGEVRERARLFDLAPVKDMERRGWLRRTDSPDELRAELCRFYGVQQAEQVGELRMAARKSDAAEPLNPAQLAWCQRVRQLAPAVAAKPFRKEKARERLADLRALMKNPEEVRKVPALLAEIGIRLVVVEHLPKTKVDGVAFTDRGEGPVVALSMRFDRVDYFWFTLAHELAHVLLGHVDPPLDDDLAESRGNEERSDIEREADAAAADLLIPKDVMDSFILRKRPFFSKKAIIQFANRIGVHPGIVVGQLQHRKAIEYSHSREMLVGVRDQVIGSALTDGWGQQLTL